MKLMLRLRPDRPLNHAEAVGCLTANLALPGTGSLAAGRVAGYFQLALSLAGFLITLIGGVGLLRWFLASGGFRPSDDPMDNLIILWRHARWPLLGIAVFLAALLWALATSWRILAAHPKEST